MSDYRELIERLERLDGIDRELDCLIASATGSSVQAYTASIDAAIGLLEKMLPGWDLEIFRDVQGELWTVGVAPTNNSVPAEDTDLGQHELGAIAILLALLRALQSQQKERGEAA